MEFNEFTVCDFGDLAGCTDGIAEPAFKATPSVDGERRFLFIEPSNANWDRQKERILQEALAEDKDTLLAAWRTWNPAATHRGAGHRKDADRRSSPTAISTSST
jgi:hypothetical protein